MLRFKFFKLINDASFQQQFALSVLFKAVERLIDTAENYFIESYWMLRMVACFKIVPPLIQNHKLQVLSVQGYRRGVERIDEWELAEDDSDPEENAGMDLMINSLLV